MSFQNRPLLLLLDRLASRYGTSPWTYLCGPPMQFDADSAVFAFGAAYEAEMEKLPGEASEMTRQAKHRELLGLDEREDEPSERAPVDVIALLNEVAR